MLSAPRIYLLEGRATSGHKQEDPDPRGGQKSTESKGSQPRTGQDHDPMFFLVQGSFRDPSLGYQTARKVLEERFGHPFRIASQYVTKQTEGPPLKPSDRTRQDYYHIHSNLLATWMKSIAPTA